MPTGRRDRATPGPDEAVSGRPKTNAIERFDASKLLCVYVALSIAIPSSLVVPGLGAAGAPALLFGLLLLVRWAIASLQGATPPGRTALHWALLLFGMALVASYVAAQMRPLETIELNGGDRGLIRLASWAGVLLASLDGLPNRKAFERVLRAAGIGGAFLAVLGLLQSYTGIDVASYIHIPGLHPNNGDFTIPPELRNGIPRIHATASHPIEYSTVLVLLIATVSPLALRNKASNERRWWFAVLIAMGLAFPQAVARSGFLAALVLAVVVIPGLPNRARRKVLIALPFGIVAVHFLFPSLLGTIRDMFSYTADGQETARTSDYSVALDYFRNSPIFGRGFGTMINLLYRTLDNQFLGTLLDAGLFGLSTFIALHLVSVAAAARGRHLAISTDDRLLGSCLIGAPLAALVSSGTFDSLSFPMFSGLLFMIFGLTGAYARLMQQENPARTRTRPPPRPNWRLRWVTISGFAVLGAYGMLQIHALPPSWISSTAVVVSPDVKVPLNGGLGTTKIAQILTETVTSEDTRNDMRAKGYLAEYGVAQGQGSLEPGTDVVGDGPLLRIQATSTNPQQAEKTAVAVFRDINWTLARLQRDADVKTTTISAVLSYPSNSFKPIPVNVGGKRAYAAIGLLVIAASYLTWYMLESFLDWNRRRILASHRRLIGQTSRPARPAAAHRIDRARA